MNVLRKVLWAIDFNSDHEISIDKMNRIKNQFGNELVLLHVLPSHIKGEASQNKITRSVKYEIQNKIAERLRLDKHQTVKVRVEVGDVANKINKVAREEKVNLIILNKGKTATLGSTGFKILRNMHKPAAVLPMYASNNEKHIVCPVDNSKASALALKSAILHARKIDAKLSVISVYNPFTWTTSRFMRAGLNEENEKKHHYRIFTQELKSFLKRFDFTGVPAEALILEGKPDEEIVKYAKKASVLYIGNSGKGALQRAFRGSVSESIICKVECAVVLLKTENLFKLHISARKESADNYFYKGNELVKLRFLQEAIVQYKNALKRNNFHMPTINALAKVCNEIGKKEEARFYQNLRDTINNKMINKKIEHEIRLNYKYST